jgi:biopolymer transport protein ExbD
MNLRKSHKEHAEVHTGPLNDILFILLLFFLIVSTLANPNVIKLSQPKAKSDTKAKQSVVISINVDSSFYVGTTRVNPEQLRDEIAKILKKETAEPTVVINADKTVPIEQVVRVMRIARDLGAKSVLAVDKNGVK